MEYLFLGETIRTITITNNGVFVSKRNNPYHSLFHKVVYAPKRSILYLTVKADE